MVTMTGCNGYLAFCCCCRVWTLLRLLNPPDVEMVVRMTTEGLAVADLELMEGPLTGNQPGSGTSLVFLFWTWLICLTACF